MHRDQRIQRVLDTLTDIERSVRADTHAKLPKLKNAPDDYQDAFIQHRIDNAVRLYCAHYVDESLHLLRKE